MVSLSVGFIVKNDLYAKLIRRGLVNDTYKMDLILVHPPHLIALACICIASAYKDRDTTSWFEELRVDMNVVSSNLFKFFSLVISVLTALS